METDAPGAAWDQRREAEQAPAPAGPRLSFTSSFSPEAHFRFISTGQGSVAKRRTARSGMGRGDSERGRYSVTTLHCPLPAEKALGAPRLQPEPPLITSHPPTPEISEATRCFGSPPDPTDETPDADA